jgi:Fic-DOC domain mobile mystery protein B
VVTNEGDGTTPLDPDEAEGLLHAHVSTRGELDELEEANVQLGHSWAYDTAISRGRSDVLSGEFLYELHKRMFGNVWKWAGSVRLTDKNIGIDKFQIRSEVKQLIDDAKYWREHHIYPPDQLAVRFHHRLVSIHPFANGNGRHARMMADILIQQMGGEPLSWGGKTFKKTSDLRTTYIRALHAADGGNIEPLLAFARS